MVSKQKVLFICTLNSFRSQIAGSLLNKMAAKNFIPYSASSHPGRIHTNAISAMKEIKIDISNHTSNWVFEYLNDEEHLTNFRKARTHLHDHIKKFTNEMELS